MAEIKLVNVVKKYGNLVALNNISFECHDGEFFTLLGPSGAGKTTILELIAGIKKPDEGEIFVAGRSMKGVPLYDRDVAMAFEYYALYPHFNIYDNIAFPLRSPKKKERLSDKDMDARIQQITQLLGIDNLLHRKPQQLSGGQKQRVSLARAMVRRPKVYLLDEPIAHLDAKLKVSARSTLKKLAGELGITIIYVTHDWREALGLSDRILVIRRGNIQQIGTPRQIYRSPESDFVARIVGDPPINLVDGQVIDKNGQPYFKAERGFEFPLWSKLAEKAKRAAWKEDGRSFVRIGVRPACVRVSREKTSEESFKLPVYVTIKEARQGVIMFELDNSFFQANFDKSQSYDVSENVYLNIDQNNLFFFDKTIALSK